MTRNQRAHLIGLGRHVVNPKASPVRRQHFEFLFQSTDIQLGRRG